MTDRMCDVVHTVWIRTVDTLRSESASRHETARDGVRALIALGGEGHRGVRRAVEDVSRVFAEAVGPERIAAGEWHRLLLGAIELAATKDPYPRQHCEHDTATSIELPPGFFELVEQRRREERERATAVTRARLDELVEHVGGLPKDERADAVRRLIPEISTWPATEQATARDTLSRKSGLTDLGATEFSDLLKAEIRQRKAALQETEQQARRERKQAELFSADAEGSLLPSPLDPLRVAAKLRTALPRPARWWRGDFYQWDGTRYVEWPPEAVDHWLYQQTRNAKYDPGGDKPPADWRPTEGKIGSLAHALARGEIYRPSADEPDDSPDRIACRNYVYDIASGDRLPHDPERFNLQALPFDFDPIAQCPTWLWFLNDVLPPDAQVLLQEWAGYLVSGRTDMEKILHMQGDPRCGKGTVATVFEALLGEENVASPSMPSLVGTFGEQPLIGKTLAIFSDINWQFRDIVEAVEVVKKISGRDSRDVNRKNREAWHGRLSVRFMIMGNDLPSFKDASGALAYRMLHVRFPRNAQGREILTLKDDLLKELPGILNWALAGLVRLNANGRFNEPQSSKDLADEVRRQQGPLQPFIEDVCVRLSGGKPVPLDVLYPVYKAWARAADVDHVLDRERFSRALSSARLEVKRETIEGVRARRVYGLGPLVDEHGVSSWISILRPYGKVPDVPAS